MKHNFTKKLDTKTMGLRLNILDYEKITRLAKKYNRNRTVIISEIVRIGLKEIK